MEEKKKHHENHKSEGAATEEKIITLNEADFQKLQQEADKAKELWDKYVRLQAEFENTRKRMEKDKQEFTRYATEEIIVELLNILDDLERSVGVAGERDGVSESKEAHSLKVFLKGVEMILAHLYDLLKKHGVRPIEAEGKIFDPHFHEALMQVVDPDVPEHTVVEELQKGYMLHDRVIRTSKVKVSKKATESEEKGRE
jgi:molecular chaperone GrpE